VCVCVDAPLGYISSDLSAGTCPAGVSPEEDLAWAEPRRSALLAPSRETREVNATLPRHFPDTSKTLPRHFPDTTSGQAARRCTDTCTDTCTTSQPLPGQLHKTAQTPPPRAAQARRPCGCAGAAQLTRLCAASQGTERLYPGRRDSRETSRARGEIASSRLHQYLGYISAVSQGT